MVNTSSTSKNHPANSVFREVFKALISRFLLRVLRVCHNKVVASTPFSNDWQYLDNFWTYQFLYATKLQLDKENFVTLKKR
ncbi:unnamed protein product [Rhizophagus irregularis]|nr:unnamed protein product [Rhizophagus irregularis]